MMQERERLLESELRLQSELAAQQKWRASPQDWEQLQRKNSGAQKLIQNSLASVDQVRLSALEEVTQLRNQGRLLTERCAQLEQENREAREQLRKGKLAQLMVGALRSAALKSQVRQF